MSSLWGHTWRTSPKSSLSHGCENFICRATPYSRYLHYGILLRVAWVTDVHGNTNCQCRTPHDQRRVKRTTACEQSQVAQKGSKLGVDGRSSAIVSDTASRQVNHGSQGLPPSTNGIPAPRCRESRRLASGVAPICDVGEDARVGVLDVLAS